MQDNNKKFYVYALYDQFGIPFYIGKGTGRRVTNHFKPSLLNQISYKNNKIKKLIKEQGFVKHEIILNNLTEVDAYSMEEFLIKSYGLIQEGGCLTNVLKSNSDFCSDTLKIGRKKSLNTNSKITQDIASQMFDLKMKSPDLTFEKIGKLFNVSGARVCDLFNGKMKTVNISDFSLKHKAKKLRNFDQNTVINIRRDKFNGIPVKVIMKTYNISKTHLYRILKNNIVYLSKEQV